MVPGAGVEEADPAADSGREVAPAAPLAAKKVLLTDTALKLFGFAAVEEVRMWPLPSANLWERSALDASVSEPPLTLTSVELTSSSTMSVICLCSISSEDPPFRAVPDELTWWTSGCVVEAE